MADIVTRDKRSEMMRGILGKDTRPELLIRRGLHALGYRYRLHVKDIPGKPDLVFPGYRAVIFIHGCFWHCHDCHLFKWPKNRKEFWKEKICKNLDRDKKILDRLLDKGWHVLIIWECSVKGKTRIDFADIMESCHNWLRSNGKFLEIRGIS